MIGRSMWGQCELALLLDARYNIVILLREPLNRTRRLAAYGLLVVLSGYCEAGKVLTATRRSSGQRANKTHPCFLASLRRAVALTLQIS